MQSLKSLHQPWGVPKQNIGDSSQNKLLAAAREKSVQDVRKYLRTNFIKPDETDEDGNTAIHLVLGEGCYCQTCQKNGETCLELLLEGGADANRKNKEGKTPMHLIAENMIPLGMVHVLVRYGASLSGKDGIEYPDLAKKLISNYPEALLATFDNGVTFGQESAIAGKHHHPVQLDWRYLTYKAREHDHKKIDKIDSEQEQGISGLHNFGKIGQTTNIPDEITEEDGHYFKKRWQETKFLYDIFRYGDSNARKKLLGHPLVHAFLELKYRKYFKFFGSFYFVFFVVGFSCYFSFLWLLYYQFCRYEDGGGRDLDCRDDLNETSSRDFSVLSNGPQLCIFTDRQWILLVVLGYSVLGLVILGPLGLLEFRKVLNFGVKEYLKLWQTWITLATIALVISTIWPVLILDRCMKLSWEYPWAAASVVFSSVAVLIQLNPIPVVAMHLEMVYKVFKQIIIAAACLFPLYLGFFASFRILITNDDIGLFMLLTMIVGDTEYESLLDEGRGRVYEGISYTLFAIFIVVMIIVVLNFLIGIAVSDIQELKDSAATNNKGNQIFSFYLMDCVLGGVRKMRHTLVKPGKVESYTYKIYPLRDTAENWKHVRKPLQFSLLDIARTRCRSTENGRLQQ